MVQQWMGPEVDHKLQRVPAGAGPRMVSQPVERSMQWRRRSGETGTHANSCWSSAPVKNGSNSTDPYLSSTSKTSC